MTGTHRVQFLKQVGTLLAVPECVCICVCMFVHMCTYMCVHMCMCVYRCVFEVQLEQESKDLAGWSGL